LEFRLHVQESANAIVSLFRGQKEPFVALVQKYLVAILPRL
jgi:hypothetical protein